MEAITRLVADSLARHGLDRSVDPRRLQWSRWFRCDSPRSLLVVPSKAGIFALAEEVMDLDPVATHDASARRMLAVLQFSEDDDMAFTLDRMFTCINPMRSRLASGRCFLRFVVIQDRDQRRSICAALNQWLLASAEKASGIGADFQSSLELKMDHVGTDSYAGRTADLVGRTLSSAEPVAPPAQPVPSVATATFASTVSEAGVQPLNTGSATNLHCPQPLPSGF